ncbi:MAG: helix-turn-helix domain-containing protein [Bacteroidales bacterium]|nr:helix-turn-helix domain-containing protein [Bacteroidales bacterium]
MTKYNKDVHIGAEIKRVMAERHISVTEFARSICCHRKNVYDIFTRKSIDIDRIIAISEILNYDFIGELYMSAVEEHTYKLRFRNGRLSIEEC